jgi:hypothetical protein
MSDFVGELATILRARAHTAVNRAMRLKIMPICGRCGGCGRYSFNGTHSTCYGCNGTGQTQPRTELQRTLVLEVARACVADGRLDAYLELLKAQERAKDAWNKAMAKWKAFNAESFVPVHFTVQSDFEGVMNAKISPLMTVIQDAGWKKDWHAVNAAMDELDEVLAWGRAQIAADPELKSKREPKEWDRR